MVKGVACLFKVGDKVVYPMHGAGVIESIEKQEVLGETHEYYIMHLPVGELKVMIPRSNVEKIGLRQVISEEGLDEALALACEAAVDTGETWNRRFRANLDKIKGGDVVDIAHVVRDLMVREREKGLSTGERKMLEQAKQILVSEMILSKEIDAHEANRLVDELGED